MNRKEFLKILELSLSLKGFTEGEKNEILYDYEEHFRIGEESHKTDQELIAELGDPETIAEQYSKEKINSDHIGKESYKSDTEDRSEKNSDNDFNTSGYQSKAYYKEKYEDSRYSSTDYRNSYDDGGRDRVIASFDFGRFSGSIIMVIALLFFNLIFVLGPYVGILGALIGLFGAAIGVFAGGIGLLIGTAFMPLLPHFISFPALSPFALFFFGIGMIALGILFFIGNCFLAKYLYLGTVKYIRWNIRVIRN